MKVSFKMLNWDEDFQRTMKNGTGFLIDTSIDYKAYLNNNDIDVIKKIFSLDGIYSYKFGMSNQINNDDPILKKMYTCKCHKTYGLENLDNACEYCNTKVRKSIPYRHGWIDLNQNKILHPHLCWLLMNVYRELIIDKKAESVTLSADNIEYSTEDDEDESDNMTANVVKPAIKKTKLEKGTEAKRYSLFDLLSKNKLEGFTWNSILFGGKLQTFIDKYLSNKAKEIYSMLGGVYFVSKIPVLSAEYRPIKISKKISIPDITQNSYNVKYMNIAENAKELIEENPNMLISMKVKMLVNIMKDVGSIMMDVIKTVGGNKKAHLRGETYSRMFYNSGRLIIEPIVDKGQHETDVCQLPLDVFRSTFVEAVLQVIDKYPITPEIRNKYVDPDQILSPVERDFIRDVVFPQIEHPYVYVSREPCIYSTSSIALRVAKLTDDEMVLRIPFVLLPAMGGDFDGDVLAMISWMDPEERKRVYQMIGPSRSIIDTIHIGYNSRIGQSNNKAVLLYRAFSEDAKVERIN